MNVFGIALTPGHLIVAAVLVVLYDSMWTWAFNNKTSAWWFEQLQGLLKVGIYLGFTALIVLLAYTPWPFNLILAVSTALSVISIVAWLHRRNKNKKETKKK